jgi:hypothetical protein
MDTREEVRIYIAARVSEATRVEELLAHHGIEYRVEIEPYTMRLLGVFPREYKGANFYVLSGQGGFCRSVLRKAGLTTGIIDEE